MAVYAAFFSPTGGTKKTVKQIAKSIKENTDQTEIIEIDFTRPQARSKSYKLGAGDILVLGAPVYAGRIPATIEPALANIKGDGSPAVAVAVYGNRDYEDALLETADILGQNGFKVISGGAFIAEHSYTAKVGTSRPDPADMSAAEEFGRQSGAKITAGSFDVPTIKGKRPYKERKPSMHIAPGTTEACYDCMLCAASCPTEAISMNNPRETDAGKCILCFACAKVCPVQAKVCDNEMMLKARAWLEGSFTARREPELFI